MVNPFGFVTEERQLRAFSREERAKQEERIKQRQVELRGDLRSKLEENEARKRVGLKPKTIKGFQPKKEVKKKTFSQLIRDIGKSVNPRQVRQSNMPQRQIPSQPLPYQPQEPIRNFFEHRDNYEVFGSDELRFFDVDNPKRQGRTTGSFFGI